MTAMRRGLFGFFMSRTFKVQVPHQDWRIRAFSNTHSTTNTEDEYFYRCTTARWFQDEKKELEKRYLKFNIPALKQAAVDAVEGATSVINMEKISDAGYNKILSLTMDTGQDVVARLAFPSVGPIEKVVESEVATMEFSRTKLGIPVPRILGWCSNPEDTDVSSAYIIMEKVQGVPLFSVWDTMSFAQKCQVVDEIIDIQKKLVSFKFPAYGSIYFRDIIKDRTVPIDDDYVLGPALPLCLNDAKRNQIDVYRGPWSTVAGYIKTVVNVEKKWILEHANPQSFRGNQFCPEDARNPATHIALLDKIEKLLPYITLKPIQEVIVPALWHPAFSSGDIIISYNGLCGTSKKMVSLIDWQHSSVLPLYLQAEPTPLFVGQRSYYGINCDAPVLNPDDHLELVKYYFQRLAEEKESLIHCLISMSHKLMRVIRTMVKGSFGIWDGSYMRVWVAMVSLENLWSKYLWRSVPFPCPKSEEEYTRYEQEMKEFNRIEQRRREFCELIGVNTENSWLVEEHFSPVFQEVWSGEGENRDITGWEIGISLENFERSNIQKIEYYDGLAWAVPVWHSTVIRGSKEDLESDSD